MSKSEPPKTTGGDSPTKQDSFERRFRRLDNKEARLYRRVPCSEDTHFAANRTLFQGIIKNVSKGGIFVQTKDRFEVGQEIIVAGPFGENNEDVKQLGKVVWQNDTGIAIQFIRRRPAVPRR
jgi:hypothetical protein